MSRNLTPFFATETDLMAVFKLIGETRPMQFVTAGLFDSACIRSEPCLPKSGPVVNYLVADKAIAIETRDVPQRDGGHKFAIDQVDNPKTVVLRPGGLIDEKCLIAGQVGTVSKDSASVEIYRAVVSEIREQFTLIKTYYVGKEAFQLLQEGVRLTTNPKSSPIYDLRP